VSWSYRMVRIVAGLAVVVVLVATCKTRSADPELEISGLEPRPQAGDVVAYTDSFESFASTLNLLNGYVSKQSHGWWA